ncbi:hypothetical protein ACWERV_07530 [Streptomyces sp. NPDC004031]
MALIPWNSVFDVIELRMADPALIGYVRLMVPADSGPVPMSPHELREVVAAAAGAAPLRDVVWREAIRAARTDSTPERIWRLLVVWLALPKVRRAAFQASRRLRADCREMEAELLVGLLEALESADPDHSDGGNLLIKYAIGRMWRAARQGIREVPHADVDRVVSARRAAADDAIDQPLVEADWLLSITPPERPDGLAAELRFVVDPAQVEGERLGALAERLSLRDIVYRARRPVVGPRIGTLALLSAGEVR